MASKKERLRKKHRSQAERLINKQNAEIRKISQQNKRKSQLAADQLTSSLLSYSKVHYDNIYSSIIQHRREKVNAYQQRYESIKDYHSRELIRIEVQLENLVESWNKINLNTGRDADDEYLIEKKIGVGIGNAIIDRTSIDNFITHTDRINMQIHSDLGASINQKAIVNNATQFTQQSMINNIYRLNKDSHEGISYANLTEHYQECMISVARKAVDYYDEKYPEYSKKVGSAKAVEQIHDELYVQGLINEFLNEALEGR